MAEDWERKTELVLEAFEKLFFQRKQVIAREPRVLNWALVFESRVDAMHNYQHQ